MSTTIILSSHSLFGRPPDRKSTQEAFHWKLRLRSTFKSDINVGVKVGGGKLEQSEGNTRGGRKEMLPIGPRMLKQGMTFRTRVCGKEVQVLVQSLVYQKDAWKLLVSKLFIMSSMVILVPESDIDVGCYLNSQTLRVFAVGNVY
jgi:hypothetical protein